MNTNNIIWNENGTPVSIHFNDIYFSNDDAIAESNYVFIEGNRLTERFLQHQKATFIIGETGFGSGLNFLTAWQCFLQFRQQYPKHILKKLHFVSVEKYPLARIELNAIHQKIIFDPTLKILAGKLQHSWTGRTYQFDTVLLKIIFTDITQFAIFLEKTNTTVDAWFFDGFCPTKNPDMWSAKLFTDLYQVTQTSGTFATFTASGQVRRNLLTAGFKVIKRKGFAKKREMLVGYK